MKAETIRYRIWSYSLKFGAVTSDEVASRFKVKMAESASALNNMVIRGFMTRVRPDAIGSRTEYSAAPRKSPRRYVNQKSKLLKLRGNYSLDEIRRIALKKDHIFELVDPLYLVIAREIECAPLIRLAAPR